MSAPDQSQLVVRGPPARNDDRGNHHAVHGMATALSGGLRRRSPKSRVAAAMDSRAARQSKAHVQRQSADASHGGTCFARRYASQAQSRRRRWPERPGFTGAALSETIGSPVQLRLDPPRWLPRSVPGGAGGQAAPAVALRASWCRSPIRPRVRRRDRHDPARSGDHRRRREAEGTSWDSPIFPTDLSRGLRSTALL
jgi:hypothetical protein